MSRSLCKPLPLSSNQTRRQSINLPLQLRNPTIRLLLPLPRRRSNNTLPSCFCAALTSPSTSGASVGIRFAADFQLTTGFACARAFGVVGVVVVVVVVVVVIVLVGDRSGGGGIYSSIYSAEGSRSLAVADSVSVAMAQVQSRGIGICSLSPCGAGGSGSGMSHIGAVM